MYMQVKIKHFLLSGILLLTRHLTFGQKHFPLADTFYSARWVAKSSTFSESLLAQGPGGFDFLRIGGSGVCGLFLDLSGFQMVLSSR